MSNTQLGALYKELNQAFNAGPSGLKRCGELLAQLKVRWLWHAFLECC